MDHKTIDDRAVARAADLSIETQARADELAAGLVDRERISDLSTRLLLSRFDTQERRFDAQDKVLEGIQREVRRTNGRVTALESSNASLSSAKQAVEVSVTDRRNSRRWRIEILVPLCAVTIGVLLGDVLQHAHIF